jgi:hypothetical protein
MSYAHNSCISENNGIFLRRREFFISLFLFAKCTKSVNFADVGHLILMVFVFRFSSVQLNFIASTPGGYKPCKKKTIIRKTTE